MRCMFVSWPGIGLAMRGYARTRIAVPLRRVWSRRYLGISLPATAARIAQACGIHAISEVNHER